MGTSLREEMISLSLFGGRLALAELILFSVFLTDILLLGIMGEIGVRASRPAPSGTTGPCADRL